MRHRLVHLCCIFIMLPVLPLYLLRVMLQACVDFIDWSTEGRAWCQPFVNASEWFELKFDPPERRSAVTSHNSRED